MIVTALLTAVAVILFSILVVAIGLQAAKRHFPVLNSDFPEKKKLIIKFGSILVLVVFLLLLSPLMIVWALNTLFPMLAIPYTFQVWAAVIILAAAVKSMIKN
jgi:hypothetical protein